MTFFDQIGRLVKSNLDNTASEAKDPETVINQKIHQMKKDLIKLRQALASAISKQKPYQQQYNQNQSQAKQWDSRAQLAIRKGDKNLASESLQRKKSYIETAYKIKSILDQYTTQVNNLKGKIMILESKISEAQTQKNMLKAKSQAVETNDQLPATVGEINPSGVTVDFERMLVGADIESQFTALETQLSNVKHKVSQNSNTSKSEIDDELTAMKDQLVLIEKILKQQTSKANTLKKNLINLESKVSEAKTQKNMLKVRS